MRDIKINSTSDLESFLKILAEESVRKSKDDIAGFQLSESDESSYQSELAGRIKDDTARFDEADEDEGSEDDDVEISADKGSEAETEEEAEEEVSVDYYSMRDEINKIRAGESTKDSDISTPLEKYIMSDLDNDERQAMYTFLSSVANIMNKTGTDPEDPSDPPNSLDIKSKKQNKRDPESQKEPEDRKEKPVAAKSASGAEDISPPIKVGSQMKETLRARVRELMKG